MNDEEKRRAQEANLEAAKANALARGCLWVMADARHYKEGFQVGAPGLHVNVFAFERGPEKQAFEGCANESLRCVHCSISGSAIWFEKIGKL